MNCKHEIQYGAGLLEGKCVECGERIHDPSWLAAIKSHVIAGRMEAAAKVYQWHTGSNNAGMGQRRVRIANARRWVRDYAKREGLLS